MPDDGAKPTPATIHECFEAAQELVAQRDPETADAAADAAPASIKLWGGNYRERPVNPVDPKTYQRAGIGDPVSRPDDWLMLSPVVPLGTAGGVFYYLDPLGQVRALSENHGRSHLIALFAPHVAVLENWWSRWKKLSDGDFEWSGCDWDKAAIDLIEACARKGVWTPFGRVRGVGAWRGDGGELILHCGDRIWRGPVDEGSEGEWCAPGPIDGQVYAAGDPQPRPDFEGCSAPLTDAAHRLGKILQGWRWQRKGDWMLLLGWLGAAMIGGALSWRPAVWLTGDAGTGKSTLQEIIKHLLGETLVQSADASGAGIWQVVGMSSRPVAIDELEPSDNPQRTKAVIDLARQAASGAVILRGGQDHSGHQFRAQSAFLFSSILIPPMTEADRSRLAMLELEPLTKGATLPHYTPAQLADIGVMMRTRLAVVWHRLRPTLDAIRRGLAAVGHVSRSADQFGSLLAVAYLLRTDEPLTDEKVGRICAPYAAAALVETADKLSDWQEMLLRLGSHRVDAYRGGNRRTLSKIIADAAADHSDHVGIQAAKDANDTLSQFGLRIIRSGDVAYAVPEGMALAIANKTHGGLAEVFMGSKWASGVWEQSAGRVPGACKAKSALRFEGQQHRATLIPLSCLQDPTGVRPSGPTEDGGAQGNEGQQSDVQPCDHQPDGGHKITGFGAAEAWPPAGAAHNLYDQGNNGFSPDDYDPFILDDYPGGGNA
jgi:hypothetical protein